MTVSGDRPLRFLALGDSYTIGEGVSAAGRWPQQLAEGLRAAGHTLADPQIVAVTGWTTDELSAGMDAATLAPPYDLVSLLIGVNDQYRGRDAADYRVPCATLLARAVRLAGDRPQRVLAVSIPDWGVTRFAAGQDRDRGRIAAELDAYNTIARGLAGDVGARWVDVTAASRACGDAADMLAEDGLHPSARQYAHWTEVLLPVVLDMLRPDTDAR